MKLGISDFEYFGPTSALDISFKCSLPIQRYSLAKICHSTHIKNHAHDSLLIKSIVGILNDIVVVDHAHQHPMDPNGKSKKIF